VLIFFQNEADHRGRFAGSKILISNIKHGKAPEDGGGFKNNLLRLIGYRDTFCYFERSYNPKFWRTMLVTGRVLTNPFRNVFLLCHLNKP
jgi:hypothetical protein